MNWRWQKGVVTFTKQQTTVTWKAPDTHKGNPTPQLFHNIKGEPNHKRITGPIERNERGNIYIYTFSIALFPAESASSTRLDNIQLCNIQHFFTRFLLQFIKDRRLKSRKHDCECCHNVPECVSVTSRTRPAKVSIHSTSRPLFCFSPVKIKDSAWLRSEEFKFKEIAAAFV